jgi:hypothetical protein
MCICINIHPTKVTVDERNKPRELIWLKQQEQLILSGTKLFSPRRNAGTVMWVLAKRRKYTFYHE